MKTTLPVLRSLSACALFALFALQNAAHGDDLWDIYQTALTHDAAYRAAGYEYESARLALPLAKSAFRPSLALQGTANRADTFGTPGTEDTARTDQINLNADLRVYDRALYREVDQAKLQADNAQIRFAQAHDDLIIRAADRYFGLLAAVDGKEVARRQTAAIQRQMDFASKRLAVGLGTETDLLDAQARFQQAVSDEIQADNRIDNAVQALKRVIGATPAPAALASLGADAPLTRPAPDSVDAWVEKALQHNLALRAANLDLEIARVEIAKQKSARWPSLTLNASQRHAHSTGANATGGTDSTSVGATLNWPLHLRGAIHIRTRQAAHRFHAAEQQREERKRQVESDTASAYLAVVSGISRVAALSEAIRAGEGSLKAKEEGFRAGLTTNLDVLDAQRDLSRSRTNYLSARYDFILAVLRLERLAGDLDEGDVKRVNGWLGGG